MNDSSFITELLRGEFPSECEAVGPTNLQDIIDAEVKFTPAEHGSYLDLGDAIGILVAATAFIKSAVDAYIALKNEHKRKPQQDEIEIKIVAPKNTIQRLDAKTRYKLLKGIIQKLDER